MAGCPSVDYRLHPGTSSQHPKSPASGPPCGIETASPRLDCVHKSTQRLTMALLTRYYSRKQQTEMVGNLDCPRETLPTTRPLPTTGGLTYVRLVLSHDKSQTLILSLTPSRLRHNTTSPAGCSFVTCRWLKSLSASPLARAPWHRLVSSASRTRGTGWGRPLRLYQPEPCLPPSALSNGSCVSWIQPCPPINSQSPPVAR